ncbi:MAG: hypothetical protein MUD08_14530 [Cytophagales bacterium]|nr:hypothetical protein [Cytophagales bacterium]
MTQRSFLLFFLSVALGWIGCKQRAAETSEHIPPSTDNGRFPEVIRLKDLRQTAFVPTLESPLPARDNVIYTPALLFAWQEIKQLQNCPIQIGENNSSDFKMLNQSSSFVGSLAQGEYQTETEVGNGAIVARAFFSKSLPFDTELDKFDEPMAFGKDSVAMFGMHYYHTEIADVVRILY